MSISHAMTMAPVTRWLMLATLVASLVPARAEAPDTDGLVLHVFWSLTCPVCIRQKPWIDGLEARFPGLRMELMELSGSDR